jgi:hypothetical protein
MFFYGDLKTYTDAGPDASAYLIALLFVNAGISYIDGASFQGTPSDCQFLCCFLPICRTREIPLLIMPLARPFFSLPQ